MSTRTIALTLAPTDDQAAAFLRLRGAFMGACNYVSGVAWETQTFNSVRLHHLTYQAVRERFGLMAQHAVRAIGSVAASYKKGHGARIAFRPDGAVVLDTPRLYRLKGNHVEITTLAGRTKVNLNIGGIQRDALARALSLGEADLIRDARGRWRLLVSARYADTPPLQTEGVLGVDLGRTSLAVSSDGETFSGAQVTATRDRYARTRRMIQTNVSKGTRSSRRRGRAVLARLSGRERRFQSTVNHTISRRLITSARGSGRAIAMEDLRGIRARVNKQPRGKTERRRANSWAFYQLRSFVTYKCADAGLPLVLVEPRYTSQTCHRCLRIGKRSGQHFHCVAPFCAWAGDADYNAACNIALLGAAVMSPRGPYPSCSLGSRGAQGS